METVLDIQSLSLTFHTEQGEVHAVRDVSLSLQAGEIMALVGESGCGKSTLCRSVVKLLPEYASITKGAIYVKGKDVVPFTDAQMRDIRMVDVGMVFQNPLSTLNPVLSVGKQMREALERMYPTESEEELNKRAADLLELVGISNGQERLPMMPSTFSGGQQQRITLAIALATKPSILLADEPTTALDVTVQLHLLDLLKKLAKTEKLAILLVTHDLGVAARIADRIGIMYAGRIIETGTVEDIFYRPEHPYTWGLLGALPSVDHKQNRLVSIPGMPPDLSLPIVGDAFADRNEYALGIDYKEEPPMFSVSDTHKAATWLLDERAPKIEKPSYIPTLGETAKTSDDHTDTGVSDEKKAEVTWDCSCDDPTKGPLLEVEHITKTYHLLSGRQVQAVDDVSFFVEKDEIVGIIGESGCGKSTLARMIAGVLPWTSGDVYFNHHSVSPNERSQELRQDIHLIFQDSDGALNPRMTVEECLREGLSLSNCDTNEHDRLLDELLADVGLEARHKDMYPGELSGGQRQRVAIARALACEPKLLIADEPIASLDVSIQAQIINLLLDLQKKRHFSMLFIAHDLSIVRYISDRVIVMYNGHIVESGTADEVFDHPEHEYTKTLLSSILTPYSNDIQAAV